MNGLTKRGSRIIAVPALITALILAGCSQQPEENSNDPAESSNSDQITLTMSWWGNDARAEATQAALDNFKAEHPNIIVKTEVGPFDNYHDKISTQIAGNAAPDVQQLQAEYMAQYGAQGALLELTDVDTSLLDEGTTSNGYINDAQVAVPTGLSTLTIIANPDLFDAAGVDMPDDTTWTWDDFAAVSKAISDNTEDGIFGTKSLGWDISEMSTWVAQQGNDLWTEDGTLGATREDFASLFELAKQLLDEGGAPSASETSEQLALSPEQSGVATGRYAMQLDAVSNFPAVQAAAAGDLKLLRLPARQGDSGDHKMTFVASQYWGVSARSEHPAEAQLLVDYLSNNIEAGKTLGISRSTPANSEFREAIMPDLGDVDRTVVDFMNEVSGEVVPSRIAPPGVATFTADLQRFTLEVLFDRMTPLEAADGLIEQTESNL